MGRKQDRRRQRRKRDRLIEAQGGYCGICGRAMSLLPYMPHTHPAQPTRDHVTPKCLGGSNNNNLIAAHRSCNSKKNDRPPTACEMIWLDVANTGLRLASISNMI